MKSPFLLIAAVLISLGLGIVIGRKTTPESDTGNSESSARDSNNPSDYRSSRIGKGNGSGRHGGASPEARVGNKVKHMTRLAEELNMERGMPDFDALFGIWETAKGMTPNEIKLALEEIKSAQLPQQSQMFMKAMLVMQWAKKDGQSAMAYTLNETGQRRFFPMKEMALQAWASSDPNGAYSWYEANKESLKPRERKQFEAQAIAALAKDNFASAFQKAKNVDSSSRKEVLQNLGVAVANNPEQRDQLLRYIQTLDDKDILDRTGLTMARQIAMTDVQEAIGFAEKWPGEDKSDLYEQVAEQWGQTDPEKAIAWQLSQLPENNDAAEAIEDVFADWARRTPDEAEGWLEKQDNLNHDKLRSEAADRMRWDDDYERAVSWVTEIKDEELRSNKYRNIYSSWQRDDKEGAQRWLEAQTPELRASIENKSKAGREFIVPATPHNH